MKDLTISSWKDIMSEQNEEYDIGVDSYGWLKIHTKDGMTVAEISTRRNPRDIICDFLKLYDFNIIFTKKSKQQE